MTPARLAELTQHATPKIRAYVAQGGTTFEKILENFPTHWPPLDEEAWWSVLAELTVQKAPADG